MLASVETGDVPISLLLDEQSGRVYVSNRGGVRVAKGEGTPSLFNAETLSLLHTLPLPPHPNSLALDAVNKMLFVTVKNDGDAAEVN